MKRGLDHNPENIPLMFNEPDLEITKAGTIKIDFQTMMTTIEGVFAAGDIVRGASLVVWGIKDGRDAAQNMHSYLKEKNKQCISQSKFLETHAI